MCATFWKTTARPERLLKNLLSKMARNDLMAGLPDLNAKMAKLKSGINPTDTAVSEAHETGGLGDFLQADKRASCKNRFRALSKPQHCVEKRCRWSM